MTETQVNPPLAPQTVSDFINVCTVRAEQLKGMNAEERQSFSLRTFCNRIVYDFLNAHGYAVTTRKDRRGNFYLYTEDGATKMAALQLEKAIACQ